MPWSIWNKHGFTVKRLNRPFTNLVLAAKIFFSVQQTATKVSEHMKGGFLGNRTMLLNSVIFNLYQPDS